MLIILLTLYIILFILISIFKGLKFRKKQKRGLHMDVKKEIIEIVNKIENERLLKMLLNTIEMAYKQYVKGKWEV